MTKRTSRTEKPDKDEAIAKTDSDASAMTPMDRFRSLARRLVRVPKDAIRDDKRRNKIIRNPS
jgi:hypothetical protein